VIRLSNFPVRFLLTQKVQGRIKRPTKMAIQFIGRLRVAEGSKMENKLAIIFILRFGESNGLPLFVVRFHN
jgi:hypothetical protein